ncbi:MAG: hypothetical protein ACK5ZU_15385 [Acidobacteriota bacterium]
MRRVMAGLWWVVVLGVCCVWGQEGVFEIRVTLSKGQANFDGDLGIGAEMRNVSGERMRVYEEDMVLVGPPEMGGGGDCVVWGRATIPGAGVEGAGVEGAGAGGRRSVTVPAGEAVSAFWDLRGMGCGGGAGKRPGRESLSLWARIWHQLQETKFQPGTYQFTVQGRAYGVGADGVEAKSYRLVGQAAPVNIAISLSGLMWGAFLGGVCAFVIRSRGEGGHFAQWESIRIVAPWEEVTVKKAGNFLVSTLYQFGTAGLMSCVITILISRLGETQLPVKVAVNDFWGAIAIGVVANYSGESVLARLSGGAGERGGGKGKPT